MTAVNSPYPLVPIANSQLRAIKSSIMGQEYQVKIRLPEEYGNTTKQYPVLYLLDGDHAFAMATDIVQYLIYGQHIPDLIIASPAYDSKKLAHEGGKNRRVSDLAPFRLYEDDAEPAGMQYLEFLQQEFIPFIESNYRVLSSDRTIWGYSRGGIFTLYTLFQNTSLFQRYIVVDGFDERYFEMEEMFASEHTDLPIKFFLAAPPDDLGSKKFYDVLVGRKYTDFHSEFVQLNNIGHFAVGAEGLTKGLVSVYRK